MNNNHPYFNHPYFNMVRGSMNTEPTMPVERMKPMGMPAANVVIIPIDNLDAMCMANPISTPPIPIDAVPVAVAPAPSMHLEFNEDSYKKPSVYPCVQDHKLPGVYTPNVVDHDMKHPAWIESDPDLCYVKGQLFNFKRPEDGYRIDVDSCIIHPANSIFNGMIAAQVVQHNPDGFTGYPTYITMTEDAGLREVHFNKNGIPVDDGPVQDVCFIGNDNRPEGLYVPMSNGKAMADAVLILKHRMEYYENMLMKDLSEVSLPEAHECNCDGKCGGNCKCKHEHDDFDL